MDIILYYIRDNIVSVHYFIYAFVCFFLMFALIGYLYKQKYAKVEIKLNSSQPKKEEQVDAAKQVLKDAKKYSDKEVMSSYAYVSGTYEQGAPQYASISAADELSIAFDKYYSSSNRPSANQQNPKDVIENMYAVIEPTIEAYEALIDADYKLSGGNKAHYHSIPNSNSSSSLQPYITCYMWKRTA